jgi:protein O-GlcNAc transferase
LCNLNLRELAAETPEQFVQIAVALAGDLPRLANLRQTLRLRMQASPLMNSVQFAAGVEAAYRRAWERWCTGT